MIIGIIGTIFSGGSFLLQVKDKIDLRKKEKFLGSLMKKGIINLDICKHFHSFYQNFYLNRWCKYALDYKNVGEDDRCRNWEELYNGFIELREKELVASDLDRITEGDLKDTDNEETVKIVETLGVLRNVDRLSHSFSKMVEYSLKIDEFLNEYNAVYEEKREFKSSLHNDIERCFRGVQINSDISLKELITILYVSIHR